MLLQLQKRWGKGRQDVVFTKPVVQCKKAHRKQPGHPFVHFKARQKINYDVMAARKKQKKQEKQEAKKKLGTDGVQGILERPLCLYLSLCYSDACPLIEVRDLGPKGLIVVIIHNVPCGARGIVELALLIVSLSTGDVKGVMQAIEKLPLSQQNLYLGLHSQASP
jgi:hypothetical protein